MSDRLTLLTTFALPSGELLCAAHYLSDDEDIGAAIRERMDTPGAQSVMITRESKEAIFAHLRAQYEAKQFTLPERGGESI
jgi:hypothetical protein